MRPGLYGKLGLLLSVFFLSSCGQMNLGGGGGGNSNNKGKIEGTRWSNHAGSIKRAYFRTDVVRLDFRGDGSLVFQAGPERIAGRYDLGNADMVYLTLDKAFAGSKYFSETITIAGDTLIMADADGTSITFRKTGGPPTKSEPPAETPPATKSETKPEPLPEPPLDTKPDIQSEAEIESKLKSEAKTKVDPKIASLRGIWKIAEATYDGKNANIELSDCLFIISSERMTLRIKGRAAVEATYTCDFAQQPHHIELSWVLGANQDKKAFGLLQISDDTLQIVLADPGQPRPADLSALFGAKHEKLVLKRRVSKKLQ